MGGEATGGNWKQTRQRRIPMNRMLSIVKRAERAERNLCKDAKQKPIAASLVSLLWTLIDNIGAIDWGMVAEKQNQKPKLDGEKR